MKITIESENAMELVGALRTLGKVKGENSGSSIDLPPDVARRVREMAADTADLVPLSPPALAVCTETLARLENIHVDLSHVAIVKAEAYSYYAMCWCPKDLSNSTPHQPLCEVLRKTSNSIEKVIRDLRHLTGR